MISIRDKKELVVVGMIAVYAAFFGFFTLSKHNSFMTYMFDLGLYDHNLWSTLNFGDPGFPLGMIHQSQLLYVLIPIYSLYPRADTLLVIQAFVVPLGALFLYKIAKKEIGNTNFALILAIVYLLYPPLHGLSQFDFHLEAFLPVLFLAAFYYFKVEKWKPYWISLVLLLLTMGITSYLTILFGAYLFLLSIKKREFRLNKLKIWLKPDRHLLVAVFGTVLLGFFFALVHFSFYNTVTLSPLLQAGPSSITLQDRADYLTTLYGPLAFLPILSASQLMALPWLAFAFFTNNVQQIQIYNQYSAYVIPFAFIGVVQVMKRVRRKKRVFTLLTLIMISTTAIYIVEIDPVFSDPYKPITPRWPVVTSKDRVLADMIAMIPPDASVLTQNNIAPHLTNRKDIYVSLEDPKIYPDYLILDSSHLSFDNPPVQPSPASALDRLLSDDKYGLKIHCGTMDLYEKGYKGETMIPDGCNS